MTQYNVLIKTGVSGEIEMEVAEPLGANLHKVYLGGTGITYGSNLIINGGGDNTTDFTNPNANGYAEYWDCEQANYFVDYSVVTSATSGFTGNVQRVVRLNGVSGLVKIVSNLVTGTTSNDYKLWFKYRSGTDLEVSYQTSCASGIFNIGTYDANAGDAIAVELTTGAFSGDIHIRFDGTADLGTGGSVWLEIDSVMLKEIIT